MRKFNGTGQSRENSRCSNFGNNSVNAAFDFPCMQEEVRLMLLLFTPLTHFSMQSKGGSCEGMPCILAEFP